MTAHVATVTTARIEVAAAQCSCGWRGEATIDRATAELDATTHAHTIRFIGDGERWRCSCGGFAYSVESAEYHAHLVGGRIETAGVKADA